MSDVSQGPGWWLASDGRWYAPEQHPNYRPPPPLPPPPRRGPGWWQASDGEWYAPQQHPDSRPHSPPSQTASGPPLPVRPRRGPWLIAGPLIVVVVVAGGLFAWRLWSGGSNANVTMQSINSAADGSSVGFEAAHGLGNGSPDPFTIRDYCAHELKGYPGDNPTQFIQSCIAAYNSPSGNTANTNNTGNTCADSE
jgi:hypothetical protein